MPYFENNMLKELNGVAPNLSRTDVCDVFFCCCSGLVGSEGIAVVYCMLVVARTGASLFYFLEGRSQQGWACFQDKYNELVRSDQLWVDAIRIGMSATLSFTVGTYISPDMQNGILTPASVGL